MKAAYLDWAGDAGFKFRAASSRYLSISVVASKTLPSDTLDIIREQFHLGKAFYFHFTNASELIKPPFFAALARTDLQGVVLRVDKLKLSETFHKMSGAMLIGYFVAEAASHLPEQFIAKQVLIFDGSRDEIALTQIIRVAISAKLKESGLPRFRRVTPRPAREEDGLQVADMLAGAAASEHLPDTALLGRLQGKVELVDFSEVKQNRLG